MAQRRSFKVSCLGNCRIIDYKADLTYDEILKKMMLQFEIPSHHKSSLRLTNKAGKVFSRRQLHYYLALFSQPRITFYLSYDNKSASTSISNSNPKCLNRKRDCFDEDCESAYPTTPVFRMNCFKGVYPSKCSPPPTKRVRFNESLNSVKVIPARRKKTNQINTNSFIGIYPENTTTNESFNQSNSLKAEARSGQQLTGFTQVHRTKSFINNNPTMQQAITEMFKQKVRRALFSGTKKRSQAFDKILSRIQ